MKAIRVNSNHLNFLWKDVSYLCQKNSSNLNIQNPIEPHCLYCHRNSILNIQFHMDIPSGKIFFKDYYMPVNLILATNIDIYNFQVDCKFIHKISVF